MLLPTGDMLVKGKVIARKLLEYRGKFQRLASPDLPSHQRFGAEIDALISDFDEYRAKLPSFLNRNHLWLETDVEDGVPVFTAKSPRPRGVVEVAD